jgi:hypothetical protein
VSDNLPDPSEFELRGLYRESVNPGQRATDQSDSTSNLEIDRMLRGAKWGLLVSASILVVLVSRAHAHLRRFAADEDLERLRFPVDAITGLHRARRGGVHRP